MKRPTPISAALSRNGIRQPHELKADSDSTAASSASTPEASRLPGGHADLRPARVQPAPALVAVLGDHQHRAAPLAAEPEALDEASVTSRIGAATPIES